MVNLALGCVGHYMCLLRLSEEGEDDLDLFWGEEFALGGVGGFGEFGHQWLIGVDFAGEEFSCALLAVVGEIGRCNLLSVTLLHFGNAQTSLALRSTSATVLFELVHKI